MRSPTEVARPKRRRTPAPGVSEHGDKTGSISGGDLLKNLSLVSILAFGINYSFRIGFYKQFNLIPSTVGFDRVDLVARSAILAALFAAIVLIVAAVLYGLGFLIAGGATGAYESATPYFRGLKKIPLIGRRLGKLKFPHFELSEDAENKWALRLIRIIFIFFSVLLASLAVVAYTDDPDLFDTSVFFTFL